MELLQAIQAVEATQPYKVVFSAPRAGHEYRRAELVPIGNGWQLQKYTQKQVFHQNLPRQDFAACLQQQLQDYFTQCNAFGEQGSYALRISKKGKVLLQATQAASKPAPVGHNRKKAALLPEGTVVPPLVDMGVFTVDGRVVRGMYDKYRQINRFIELVEDVFKTGMPNKLRIIDFGSGKSYLTFILYYYLTKCKGIAVEMLGMDLKADVVAACNKAAAKYGYSGLHFEVADIAKYVPDGPIDMVVTLHACDTATDYALANAVRWGAKYIFSVPCCQHELNAQMQSDNLAVLTRYGLVKERMASLMTDALRANLLTACGYRTQLVEFVELEHTPKNILIRAQRQTVPAAKRQQALAEANALCTAFHFEPTLLSLLQSNGSLPVPVAE